MACAENIDQNRAHELRVLLLRIVQIVERRLGRLLVEVALRHDATPVPLPGLRPVRGVGLDLSHKLERAFDVVARQKERSVGAHLPRGEVAGQCALHELRCDVSPGAMLRQAQVNRVVLLTEHIHAERRDLVDEDLAVGHRARAHVLLSAQVEGAAQLQVGHGLSLQCGQHAGHDLLEVGALVAHHVEARLVRRLARLQDHALPAAAAVPRRPDTPFVPRRVRVRRPGGRVVAPLQAGVVGRLELERKHARRVVLVIVVVEFLIVDTHEVGDGGAIRREL
eukprot:scaffold71608_cov63-Phaeocystis_antarctica.AAC.5